MYGSAVYIVSSAVVCMFDRRTHYRSHATSEGLARELGSLSVKAPVMTEMGQGRVDLRGSTWRNIRTECPWGYPGAFKCANKANHNKEEVGPVGHQIVRDFSASKPPLAKSRSVLSLGGSVPRLCESCRPASFVFHPLIKLSASFPLFIPRLLRNVGSERYAQTICMQYMPVSPSHAVSKGKHPLIWFKSPSAQMHLPDRGARNGVRVLLVTWPAVSPRTPRRRLLCQTPG